MQSATIKHFTVSTAGNDSAVNAGVLPSENFELCPPASKWLNTQPYCKRSSVGGLATRLRAGGTVIRNPIEAKIILSPPKCTDRLRPPPGFLFNGYRGLFPRVKRQIYHSPPSSAQVKNEWSSVATSPTWLHGVHRETFIFKLYRVRMTLYLYMMSRSVTSLRSFNLRRISKKMCMYSWSILLPNCTLA
jgi:hypothetical protein